MTASTGDYYGILGLTSDATLADVKNAYRKLAASTTPTVTTPMPGPSTGSGASPTNTCPPT
jgi:preprotein translocase subunit Sec63